jgi:hypothetical protein
VGDSVSPHRPAAAGNAGGGPALWPRSSPPTSFDAAAKADVTWWAIGRHLAATRGADRQLTVTDPEREAPGLFDSVGSARRSQVSPSLRIERKSAGQPGIGSPWDRATWTRNEHLFEHKPEKLRICERQGSEPVTHAVNFSDTSLRPTTASEQRRGALPAARPERRPRVTRGAPSGAPPLGR